LTGIIKGKHFIEDVKPQKPFEEMYQQIMITYYKGLRNLQDLPQEKFNEEYKKLNDSQKDALKLYNAMKSECIENGFQLKSLEHGCLEVTFSYESREALIRLWMMYTSGELLQTLQTGLVTDDVMTQYGVTDVEMELQMSRGNFEECLKNSGKILSIFQIFRNNLLIP